MKKFVCILLCCVLLAFASGCGQSGTETNASSVKCEAESYLTRSDWSDDVKQAIDTFIAENGTDSDTYDDSTYVVFDFDNTTAIFDVMEQFAIYQLQHMAFGFSSDTIADVLSTGLSDMDKDLSDLGYGKGSYNDWIQDITDAYARLENHYGSFCARGMSDSASEKIQQDDDWKEFATKMRTLYDVVSDNESTEVAYPWITYWLTNMTADQVYEIACESHEYFSQVETSEVTWTSPENYDSRVGQVEYTWKSGVQVTENVKELMKALHDNGIKVWICSASDIDVIRAAVDTWGLHDYVTGVLAMTDKIINIDRRANEYDYETGCGYETAEGNEWTQDTNPTKAQTQGEGKVTAIVNALCTKYGHGPSAGFMDSTGDFNFCTEFDTLKLVVCFNRANRKVTDGGGLIAEVAMYQENTLGYDLDSANAAGDTLYVLQGRDENGMRTLRNSNSTLRYGETEEKLFANEDNEKELQYMIDNKMTTEEALETFSMKTSADDADNLIGTDYGFLEEYSGYHSIESGAVLEADSEDKAA